MAPSNSTSSKKRVQSSRAERSAPLPAHQQQTISKLFDTCRSPPPGIGDAALSANIKRRKLGPPSDSRDSPSKPASIENMYNFSSSTKNSVIDLTNSNTPPTSPKARRMSGVARLEDSNPYTGVKKLEVRNIRKVSKSDPNQYCSKTIGQLDEALTAIFNNQRPALSNEELYKGAENVCKFGKASDLAAKLFERCKEHVVGALKAPVQERSNHKDVDVLRATLAAWAMWNKRLTTIRSIFFYLDRAHLLPTSSKSIQETAIGQFRSYLYGDKCLQPKIDEGACDLLLAHRTQESSADASLFREAVKMFHELSVYTSSFEPLMLGQSQTYISKWADKECSERDLPSYISACVELIDAEMKRCELFDLDMTTRRELLALLEHHLVERREAELTNQDSVADLLDDNNVDALKQLYSLLQRRRLGAKLKNAFAAWIDDTGTAIVFDEKRQDEMIIRLLEFKQRLDTIWRISFQKDDDLGHTLRESFELFMNKSKKSSATWNTDNNKPGEMIAKYVDSLLRSGAKAIPSSLAGSTVKSIVVDEEDGDEPAVDEDSEVNNQLDLVLDLFRFVHGKAVFEAFYKKDLARRLLLGRSASNDAERSMLARLKTECGSSFTQNLEQMFKDIELAREEMAAYKSRLENSSVDPRSGVDLNVNILSSAAWPTYPEIPVAIPPEIKRSVDRFEAHYHQKHSGRKLFWKHALAHCQIKASFPSGLKEIVVSSFQAVVLLLFSGKAKDEHLSYEHIKAETGLEDAELQRTLQSLACAKIRPLIKHPKGREVSETDTFTVNANFTHPKYRIKINSIQAKETPAENKETHERVALDRQFECQAAIVRIMKSRKTVTHAELVAEVISATRSRGVLSVNEIKRNVDKLVEKEYMERDGGKNVYHYLA